ncbi:hypothetical protein QQS21_000244 [Conoideocrella luteorostrata]|uniref:3'(2'),5'-bisphosphate nucleotidase n=1 Tax=Conoideocrella luteorostrata TaxID=1105319 RepID=A0AAJ0G2X8_9HYPO|nr:hypothetical protein QQS21_000244 [Conoideocrella luteorostrata]
MGSVSYAQEQHLASLAVQRAAILTKNVMRSVKHIAKTDSTPVTVADFVAQALLISALHRAFPSDGFIGEETADVLREDATLRQQVWELVGATELENAADEALLAKPSSSEEMMHHIDLGGRGVGTRNGRTWVMDPIDGTATFIRGGQYAVALALLEDGKEVVGVVACPNLLHPDLARIEDTPVDVEGYGIMLSTALGEGVILRPVGKGSLLPGQHVSARRPAPPTANGLIDPTSWNFVDSTMGEKYHLQNVKRFASTVGALFPGTDVWSTHVRLIVLGLGARQGGNVQVRIPPRAEGNDPEDYIWDYAGSQLILSELGGKATDLDGREIDFGAGRRLSRNWGLVAAPGWLHFEVLHRVQEFVG